MILKSAQIAARLLDPKDRLVITPNPTEEALGKGSAAVDLRLGTWFLTLRPARMPYLGIGSISEARATKTHYVKFGESYYLHPNNFALGVTLEWLKLPKDLAGYVVGKSSWGRRGLIIATATGVHPGFTGCLTLELTNAGEMPILLEPGMRVCQLFLHSTIGDLDSTERSTFSCRRKPVLGSLTRDPMSDALREHGRQISRGTMVGGLLGGMRRAMTDGSFSLPDEEVDLALGFLLPNPHSAEVEEGTGLLAGKFASGQIFRIGRSGMLLSLPGIFAALHTIWASLQPIAPFAVALAVLAMVKEARGAIGRLEPDAAAVIWAAYLRSKGESQLISFYQAVNAERTARGLDASNESQIAGVVDKLISMQILAFEKNADPTLAEWILVRPD